MIFLRAIGAILLTAFSSTFLVAMGPLLLVISTLSPQLGSELWEFLFIALLFGGIPALFLAIGLGLMVEWPIALRIGRRRSHKLARHILTSVPAGAALMVGWGIVSYFFIERLNGLFGSLFLMAGLGAIGGLCSALSWHWLVIGHLKRRTSRGPVR